MARRRAAAKLHHKPPPRPVRVFRTNKLCPFGEIVKDLNGRFWEHHIEPRRGRGMSKHCATYPANLCPFRCGGAASHSRPRRTILPNESGNSGTARGFVTTITDRKST